MVEGIIVDIFWTKSSCKFTSKLNHGWTVLHSSVEFFVKNYSLQENFPPCYLCFILHILFPKSNDKVVSEICIVEYTMTTVAHVRIHKNVKYHQNQISSHNQLETEQTREAWEGRPVALAVRWSIQTLTRRLLHLRVIWKKKEGRREQPKIFGSSPFQKPHRLWKRKTLADITVNYETGVKFFKLKVCVGWLKILKRNRT